MDPIILALLAKMLTERQKYAGRVVGDPSKPEAEVLAMLAAKMPKSQQVPAYFANDTQKDQFGNDLLGVYRNRAVSLYGGRFDDAKTAGDSAFALAHEYGHHIDNQNEWYGPQATNNYPGRVPAYEDRASIYARLLLGMMPDTARFNPQYWSDVIPSGSDSLYAEKLRQFMGQK